MQYQRHLAGVEESKKYLNNQPDDTPKPPQPGLLDGGSENAEQDYGWWYGMGKEKKPKSSKGIPSGPLPWIHEHPEEKGLVRPLGVSDNATEMVRWYTGKRKDWWDKY